VIRRVLILSGVPGSGKSHFVGSLDNPLVFSADDYFMTKDGVYDFTPSEIGKAHQWCFRRYVSALTASTDRLVVVDNTNTTAPEIAPYYLAAEAFDCEPTVVRIQCDPAVAFARQKHNVPANVHARMVEQFNRHDVLPWWRVQTIRTEASQ